MANKNVRAEFSAGTKRDLAMRADNRCSNYRCCRPTLDTVNKKGVPSARSTGHAAHIIGASKQGPRQAPEAMTAAQISDISNGIWLCKECHDRVDTDTDKFTTEYLKEMKDVREFTTSLLANETGLYAHADVLSLTEVLRIVKTFYPNLNDSECLVVDEIKLAAAKVTIALSRMPKHPDIVESRVYSDLNSDLGEAVQEYSQARPYFETKEAGWIYHFIKKYVEAEASNTLNQMDLVAELSTRNPITGDVSSNLCKEEIRIYAETDGSILRVFPTDAFRLSINQTHANGRSVMNDYAIPDYGVFDTGGRLYTTFETFGYDEFEYVLTWIEELAKGHQPVARLKLGPYNRNSTLRSHVTGFFSLTITQNRIEKLKAWGKRHRLLNQLSKKHDVNINIYMPYIDGQLGDVDSKIQKAIDEIMENPVTVRFPLDTRKALNTDYFKEIHSSDTYITYLYLDEHRALSFYERSRPIVSRRW